MSDPPSSTPSPLLEAPLLSTSPSVSPVAVAVSSPSTRNPPQASRTRSFSLLQNIALPMPFASRPTPLRATTTQQDINGQMSSQRSLPNPNDLPGEIVIHIESFIRQLTSPQHPAPVTPDQISSLFQSFYIRTFNLLETFLPFPSESTINLQPLLSTSEISNRKRIRSDAIIKRQIWEEEIEKRVTTGIYERIFSPKTADDTERDFKLQGKIRALVVVGVALEHLGVELSAREKELLKPAVEAVGRELHELDNVKSPREKLEILLAVHKVLVDGLSFPSQDGETLQSSSADLLLPVLIYSIIQANTETLVSNVQFIQRFRADALLQGEASYCLTNLEAAITFLETVDLPSLNLAPQEPVLPTPPPMQRTVSSSSSPSLKRRAPSLPIDSADPLNALPTDTNDSALKSLGGALETSYKLFWSKVQGVVEPPRTLDDVRKLIGRPFQADETEIKEKPDTASLSRLIVGSGTDKPIDKPINEEQRGNLITSGFRTLGTSLSRPFSTRTPPPSMTLVKQREMQNMTTEGLSGTQSRQLFTSPDSTQRKIKRVDQRYLECQPGDLRLGEIDELLQELRRVVTALDEYGGFNDA